MRARKLLYSVVGIILVVVLLVEITAVLVLTDAVKLGVAPEEFFADVKSGVSARFSPTLRKNMLMSQLKAQASVLFEQKDYANARKLAESAVNSDPSNGDMQALLANCISKTESPEKAIEYIQSLDEVVQSHIEVKRSLGAAYAQSGDTESALTIYIELAKANPEDAIALADAGWALLEFDNNNQGAREYFEKALKLDVALESALLGLLAISEERSEKKALLNSLIAIDKENANYPGQLGWMEYEDGEYDRARMYSRMAVEADSNAHYAYFNMALSELRLGRLNDSWRSYIGAAAGCVSAGQNYPFGGAIDDLKSLPAGVEAEFKGKVIGLLERMENAASPGISGYLDEELFGKEAFNFSVPDLISGKTISLEDYKGKLVFLDFWASWCGPCIEELPNVVRLQKELGAEKFQVVSISLDEENAGEELKKHIDKYGITYPVLYSGEGWKQDAAEKYGVQYIPNTWVISPDGKILFHDLRGEDPLKYCRAFLDSPVQDFKLPEITNAVDKEGLTVKIEYGKAINSEVKVIFMYGLELEAENGLLVETYSFKTDESGTVAENIPLKNPPGSLNIAVWVVEAPVSGLPDSVKSGGVINLREIKEVSAQASIRRSGAVS